MTEASVCQTIKHGSDQLSGMCRLLPAVPSPHLHGRCRLPCKDGNGKVLEEVHLEIGVAEQSAPQMGAWITESA